MTCAETPSAPRGSQHALRHAAGVLALPRTILDVRGQDAASHLHNFCTQDIKALPPGTGREAFFCNVKGGVLGWGHVLRRPDGCWLHTSAGQAAALAPHLSKYVITEDVTIDDVSATWGALLVSGPSAEGVLRAAGVEAPAEANAHLAAALGGVTWVVQRVEMLAAPTWVLLGPRAALAAAHAALQSAGAAACDAAAFDALRVENGWPEMGRDIAVKNLPQEVARDAKAISFRKGCYLGQETVARLDALGHVNKTLVGLVFAGTTLPAPGDALFAAEQPSGAEASGAQEVGVVTSAAFSEGLQAPVALGYARVPHNRPGARLRSAAGEAVVRKFPLAGA